MRLLSITARQTRSSAEMTRRKKYGERFGRMFSISNCGKLTSSMPADIRVRRAICTILVPVGRVCSLQLCDDAQLTNGFSALHDRLRNQLTTKQPISKTACVIDPALSLSLSINSLARSVLVLIYRRAYLLLDSISPVAENTK